MRFSRSLVCSTAFLAGAASGSTQEAQPDAPQPAGRPSLGGPDQVDNLLQDDRKPKKPLLSLAFLNPYFDFKDGVEEKTGLSFAVDYTTVYLAASESLGEGQAASGMLRFYGSWGLVGRDGSENTGAFIYKVENRHAYTDVSPFDLGFEIGYVGLFEPPFSDQRWRATNIYWRQTFSESRFVILGGFLDTTDYVDVYGLASPWMHFMNFAFSTGSATIATPGDATLGVAGGGWITDNVYAIAGLADANADPTKPFDGFDTFFNQREYFANVDVGWTSSRDRTYFDNVQQRTGTRTSASKPVFPVAGAWRARSRCSPETNGCRSSAAVTRRAAEASFRNRSAPDSHSNRIPSSICSVSALTGPSPTRARFSPGYATNTASRPSTASSSPSIWW